MYAIYDRSSDDVLGVYSAESEDAALDQLAQDREHPSLTDWLASDATLQRESFRLADAAELMADQGRALDGPSYRGWRWYDRAVSDRLKAEAGYPGVYLPATAACSGWWPSKEQAALAAIRPHAGD